MVCSTGEQSSTVPCAPHALQPPQAAVALGLDGRWVGPARGVAVGSLHCLSPALRCTGTLALLRLSFLLQLKIPELFCDLDIVPALLHGDLWGGNVAEDSSGPVIFDPASFYGHSEYELAIAGMFGGFSRSFYSAYHSEIPRAPGFEKRLQLYQLFHYLNHWNHFGSGYRGSSLSIMRSLTK